MDKQKQIIEMFDSIAPSYDLANRMLSFGVDVRWRKEGCTKAIEKLGRNEGLRVLDVACGTGDMILYWQKHLLSSEFMGIDPSAGMLKIAREKVSNCQFLQAGAQTLPIESESVDLLSIAYGLRNICDYQSALREFYRVLKKDGVLLILEFTHNPNPSFLEKLGLFYTQKVLPILGGLISKNKQAYAYLPDSIEHFVSSNKLSEDLQKFGFADVEIYDHYAKISSLLLASKG